MAVAVLAALFLSFSLARSPIPGVNESHYLCKARHFWQPAWCQGDLFLESANPHAVFYAAFGWLTTQLSLAQAALIIRACQSLLLAAAWLALGARCLGDTRRAITAASLFLLLQATGTWSGEWLVGGAESKVWSYGFLMLAAAWGLDRHWLRCAVAGGLAVSLHPVIGCWGAVIAVLGEGIRQLTARCCGAENRYDGRPRPSLPVIVTSLTLFALTSLPGLIPAVQSLSAPSHQVSSEADFLQVAVRLAHHLDPLSFSVRAWRDYGLLLLVWLLLRSRIADRPRALARLELWLVAALVIALIGVLAAWGPRPLKELPWWELRVKALKLYPFRLADMLVPLTIASTATTGLWQLIEERLTGWRRPVAITTFVVLALGIAFRVPSLDRTLSQQPATVQADWIAACDWIRKNSPPETLLYATNDNWSLRWYAERPEYFSFKDCPQDAASIVEWNRRSQALSQWKLSVFADGRISAAELTQLRNETGITHLVCGRFGPLDRKPVFASTSVWVYEL